MAKGGGMIRLETVSAELVAALAEAPAMHRRAAVVAACECALAAAEVDDALAAAVLEDVLLDRAVGEAQVGALSSLVEEADEAYFAIQDADDALDDEGLRCFSRARALSSLHFAAQGSSLPLSAEAIYEAISAVGDEREVLLKVASVLDQNLEQGEGSRTMSTCGMPSSR